jgi:RimJ/RimL family protein N-acetyltransferase
VDVQSLVFRTELALLQRSGSTVEDRGPYVVVRTPANPTYYWGNCLLLADAPDSVERVEHWTRVHRQEFPDAAHVTLGVDRPRDAEADAAVLREAGMEVDMVVALTAEEVHAPDRPPPAADVRVLATDDDWHQQVDLTLEDEESPHVTRDFVAAKTATLRGLVESGTGTWWGAFQDGRLVASLGVFRAGDGLTRYQSVKTASAHRKQGLAAALVVAAGRHAHDVLGARTLVIAADPTYAAIRIYRSVGFREAGTHLEATLAPRSS